MKKLKGTTLVEVIVYLALLIIVFGAIIQFALSIMEGNQNAKRRIEVQRATIFITNHIERTFGTTNAIDINNSIFSQDAGKIRLSKGANTYEYQLVGNNLIYRYNGAEVTLNNRYVKIDKFFLDLITKEDATPIGVRVTITLQSPVKDFIKQTYQTYYSLN